MTLLLAITIGGLLGFILDRVDASNPERIINMLRLKDFHLIKVILFAIGFSSLIVFILLNTGIIPPNHIKIKSAYTGVLIGGLIFGTGYAVSGYCPGTCLVGAASGRKDALFFILGGLLGAIIFSLLYGSISETFLFDKIAGGKVTVANTGIEKYKTLTSEISSLVVSGFIALSFMLIAYFIPTSKEKQAI